MNWNKTHSKSLEEKVARIKSANQELREQLKAKDKKIAELDELMKLKSCDTCKHFGTGRKTNAQCSLGVCDGRYVKSVGSFMDEIYIVSGTSKDFYCNRYEPKENR